MTLQRAKGEDLEGSVTYGDSTLHFSYNPNAVSHREWRRMRSLLGRAQENPDDPETDWVIPYLCQMLTSWDLFETDEARKPLPINAETLDMLPMKLLGDLLQQIMEKLIPPDQPASLSGSFS